MSENELIDRLLSEALETLKQVTAAVGELNRELVTIERRIENGELRREAEAEMRQWLAENPEASLLFRRNAMSSSDF